MPGTVAEELDLQLERGLGGGNPPRGNAGGGDDGRGGGRSIPRRAYITGITLAVAGIMMFFMALTSSYIVRKRNWDRLASVWDAADSVGQHGNSVAEQFDSWKWRADNWREAC